MYNFIFYFIYLGQISQKNIGPWVARCIASMIVSVFLFIHICFIYSLIKYTLLSLYDINISFPSGKNHTAKILFWYPVALVLIIVVFKYFDKKRVDRVVKNYYEKQFSYSFFNIFKFLVMFILPLTISIWLVKHSIS